MAEHRFRKAGVEGSNPSFGSFPLSYDPLKILPLR